MKTTRFILLLLTLFCALNAQAQRRDYPCFANQYQIPFPKAMINAPDTVSVIIIGDVMMHAKQLERDHHTFLQKITPALRAADFAVANKLSLSSNILLIELNTLFSSELTTENAPLRILILKSTEFCWFKITCCSKTKSTYSIPSSWSFDLALAFFTESDSISKLISS